MGEVERTDDGYLPSEEMKNWRKYFPMPSFRQYQEAVIDRIIKGWASGKRFAIVEGPTGCHAEGTTILMHDGTVKKVEDIVVGDLLCGPDSKPRLVTELHRGRQEMARITPHKGDSFIVNVDHILSLQRTNVSNKTKIKYPISNISVRDWLTKSNRYKHSYKLYRVGVDFPSCVHSVPPYELGSSYSGSLPKEYIISSREQRLEFLAGVMDTRGSLRDNCYVYCSSQKEDALDMMFLARSLGLAAYLSVTRKKTWPSYSITISGDLSVIPTQNPKKTAGNRTQIKNVLRVGFTVEILPEDNYFGFSVTNEEVEHDVKNLYVMGDFTVTHNSGKSSWAITLGRLFNNAFLCTPQKMLQNQYMADFSSYLFELKGRSNYPCLRINHEEWQEEKGKRNNPRTPIAGLDYIKKEEWEKLPKDHIWRKYNCANAPCVTKKEGVHLKKECAKYNVCEYILRRDYALLEAPFSVLNFANMLLFTRLMPKPYPTRPLLILDEAHSLESYLYEFATISIKVKHLQPLRLLTEELQDIDRITQPFNSVSELTEYITQILFPAYKKYVNMSAQEEDEEEDEDSENPDKVLRNLVGKRLAEFIASKPTDKTHVLIPEKTLDGINDVCTGLKVKPFSVAHLSHLAFGSSDSRILLMSATILDPTTFCKSLGIKKEEAFFIPVPSTFPAENRLIIGDLSVGSMSYAHKDATLPKMLDRIVELTERHSTHKGIIHTGSYEIMHKFKRWVSGADPALNSRLLFQAQGTFEEKENLIRLHRTSLEPTILCGPSFLEGIDLKEDLSRFNIIMKLPFLSLADPLVKRKAEEFPEWYSLQVALAIIQALGRSVRSPTDWAVNYILDKLWKYFYDTNKDVLIPKHIQEAIRWTSSKYPTPYK